MPKALEKCCELGKVPPATWSTEQLLVFLDVLKGTKHKWSNYGSLGRYVDLSITEGGYKELFMKEKLSGLILFGKQRKTLTDLMKRIGIKNPQHRDLIVEAICDLSKPEPPASEEEVISDKFILIRNSWTKEKKPEIQLLSLLDLFEFSKDASKHNALNDAKVLDLLHELLVTERMDPVEEKDLAEQQKAIDELWVRRRAGKLDYQEKKDLDQMEHQQAKRWLQAKSNFGSLAIVSIVILHSLAQSEMFCKQIVHHRSGKFVQILVEHLKHCRTAKKMVFALKLANRNQYLTLVENEVLSQQQMILECFLHFSHEVQNRLAMIQLGAAAALMDEYDLKTSAVNDSNLLIMRFFANVSRTGGKTEVPLIQSGILKLLKHALESDGMEILSPAVSIISNLAYVKFNGQMLKASGILTPFSKLVRHGKSEIGSSLLSAMRNMTASGALDSSLADMIIPRMMSIILQAGDAEETLYAWVILRNISMNASIQPLLYNHNAIKLLVSSLTRVSDEKLRFHMLGMLVNVLGFVTVRYKSLDEEEDEDAESEKDKVSVEGGIEDNGKEGEKSPNEDDGETQSLRNKAMKYALMDKNFFNLLSSEQTKILVQESGRIFSVERGELFVTADEYSRSLFMILEGTLTEEPDHLNQFSARHVLCSEALTEEASMARSLRASERCSLLQLHVNDLLSAIRIRPDVFGEYRFEADMDDLKKFALIKESLVKSNEAYLDEGRSSGSSLIRTQQQQQALQYMQELNLDKVLEDLANDEGNVERTLTLMCLALLVGGPDQRDNSLMRVSDQDLEDLTIILDCCKHGEAWRGHAISFIKSMHATYNLVLIDRNKNAFIRNGMIPFIIQMLHVHEIEVADLATNILLELSYGIQARWILRPVLLIWHKHVATEKDARKKKSEPKGLVDCIDFAPPFHPVLVESVSEPQHELELLEAASEGVVSWLQRLIAEGWDFNTRDSRGATALHFAALKCHVQVSRPSCGRPVTRCAGHEVLA
eukprot:753601-Hanusia_phi.AAC.2